MSKTNITFNLNVVAAAATPAWQSGQAVNQWLEIAGSSMSNLPISVPASVGSSPASARINAWCGVSLDTRNSRMYAMGNGGHTDSSLNESDALSLEDDAPTWTCILAGSDPSASTTNNQPRYTDGRPASIHSYYSQQYIERRNRAMRFGLCAVAPSVNTYGNIQGFDTTVASGVDGWDAAGTYPAFAAHDYNVAICKDINTEDVYQFYYNNTVSKWTEAANTTAVIFNYPPNLTATVAAHDPVRNRFFLLVATGQGPSQTFDPATVAFTEQTLTGSDASAILSGGVGLIYEPVLDKFLAITNAAGGTVYAIDPVTFAVTTLATAGAPPDATAGIGPYTRFQYVPKRSGVVWYPSYSTNLWFLRTH
jgi:hypothetical protein